MLYYIRQTDDINVKEIITFLRAQMCFFSRLQFILRDLSSVLSRRESAYLIFYEKCIATDRLCIATKLFLLVSRKQFILHRLIFHVVR